jgi:hypothetical protein
VNYDIHQFAKTLKRTTEAIRKDESLLDENKLAILKFIEFCQGQGLAPATIIKHIYALKHLARFLGKSFEKANTEDIVKTSKKIQDKEWSEATKRNARVTLK